MKGLSGDSEGTHGGGGEASRGAEPRGCSACGAPARREAARFCATCGHGLGGGYFPSDSVRASYRFERAPAPQTQHRPAAARAKRRVLARRASAVRGGREFMPRVKESGAASLAFAFVTYALVPYLGILFCPGALLFGGVGLVRAWRAPQDGRGAARSSALSIALGLLVFCVQLLLWWILYKVPEWARGTPF